MGTQIVRHRISNLKITAVSKHHDLVQTHWLISTCAANRTAATSLDLYYHTCMRTHAHAYTHTHYHQAMEQSWYTCWHSLGSI